MSRKQQDTISDRLFALCEQQLLSIIEEAGRSIERVTDNAVVAVQESDQLFKLLNESEHSRKVEIKKCSSLEQSVNEILTSLQFFDELSQRMEHILKIVDLIKIQSDKEGFLSDPQNSEVLLNNIKKIFSIQSEFEVMKNIFPEYEEFESGKLVELF